MTGGQPAARSSAERRTTALALNLLGPDVGDAACAGTAPLHDRDVPGETYLDQLRRHAVARDMCRRCPARPRCADARQQLGDLADGVWAGHLTRRRTTA